MLEDTGEKDRPEEFECKCTDQIIKNKVETERTKLLKWRNIILRGERIRTICTCSKVRNIITFQDPSLPKFGIKPL
jgi:hypothetical protein